jgi:hypothetical protein
MYNAGVVVNSEVVGLLPGANPSTLRYYARVAKKYGAINSMAPFYFSEKFVFSGAKTL